MGAFRSAAGVAMLKPGFGAEPQFHRRCAFLAWVRTAIAVMAFGFLVEKFDLFMAAWESRQALNLKETFAHKLVHFEH
jgi:Domain of unknown function (DUF202)